MGLESATFISGLVNTNPVAGDSKSQGDDHLRLIKAALQSTFPNAAKAFYFPDSAAKVGNYTVLASDMQKLITGDATGGAFNITLPSLAAGDAGWHVVIMKTDASANAITVIGTVNGTVNPNITRRYDAYLIWWTGSVFLATIQRATIDTADLANDSVTNAKLRNSAALSVIGNATNATADPADVAAGTDFTVLRRNGTILEFGAVDTSWMADNSISLAKVQALVKAFQGQLFHANKEATSGTVGGNLTNASWNTVALDTSKTNEIGVTLSANQMQGVTAGTYWFDGYVPVYFDFHGGTNVTFGLEMKTRLRNVTDSTTLISGPSVAHIVQHQGSSAQGNLLSVPLPRLTQRFNLAATKTLEFQVYVNSIGSPTVNALKQGYALAGAAETEVHASALLWRVG